MTDDGRAGAGEWLRRLRGRGFVTTLEILLAVVGAITIAWGALTAIVDTRNSLELLVEVDRETELFPDPEPGVPDVPALRTDGYAEVLELRLLVENAGKEVVGTQLETWQLTLTYRSAAELFVDGTRLRPRPPTVVAGLDGVEGTTVVLRLGALEPGARVEIPLVVVDPGEPAFRGLRASTSLAGLPRPIVTTFSDFEIARNILVFWLTLVLVVVLIVAAGFEGRTEWRDRWRAGRWRTVWGAFGTLLLFLVLALVNAFFISAVLAWLLT